MSNPFTYGTRNQARDLVIQNAKEHLGYRHRLGTNNFFLGQVGYPGHERWDGAFLDVVFRQSGVSGPKVPAFVNPASALRFFKENRRIVSRPEVGDIVFLAAPWDLHLGLVTDVSHFRTDGSFRTVEAQINSGLPRAAKERDGVFERTRYISDLVSIARPLYGKLQTSSAELPEPLTELPENSVSRVYGEMVNKNLPLVKPSNFVNASPRMPVSTEVLQRALAKHPAVRLRNAAKGRFDNQTRRAVAKLQRFYGFLDQDANGLPDETTLARLAREVPGLYRVPDSTDKLD